MRAGFVVFFDLANIFRRIFPILFSVVFLRRLTSSSYIFSMSSLPPRQFSWVRLDGHCGTFLPLTCLSLSEIAGQHSIGDESHVTQDGEHTWKQEMQLQRNAKKKGSTRKSLNNKRERLLINIYQEKGKGTTSTLKVSSQVKTEWHFRLPFLFKFEKKSRLTLWITLK